MTSTLSRPHSPAAEPGVTDPIRHRAPFALSTSAAVATVAAAVPTLAIDGLLHGPAAMNGSARGTALVMAVAAVPVMVASMVLARRGSHRAVPVWAGSLAYLVYNAVMLLFGTPFNAAFLLYVATLSLALWSLVALLVSVDVTRLWPDGAVSRPTRRAIAVLTWVVVGLNALAWLAGIVPGMRDSQAPAFLDGTGLTTLPTYVQDLAVWLPLLAVGAWWLWRGAAWGLMVVSAGLVMLTLEGLGVAADQTWGHLADPSATVVSLAAAPAFLVVAVVTLVPAIILLRRCR